MESQTRGVAAMVGYLVCKGKALNLNPSPTKKQRKETGAMLFC
jgi:hypothetical protein